MAAGHSLGEFSALVSCGALSFEEGLRLVAKRAGAMQRACEINPSAMAAVLGLTDEAVERICSETSGVVVAANYNCPGQLVISGSEGSIDTACENLKAAGAKRALKLNVGGAFHSPLMEPAREELQKAIDASVHNLLAAHALLMTGLTDEAGRVRSGGGGGFAGGQIVHMAPPAKIVPELVYNLLE